MYVYIPRCELLCVCYSHGCFSCFRDEHLGIRELTGVLFPGEDISPLRVPWLPVVLWKFEAPRTFPAPDPQSSMLALELLSFFSACLGSHAGENWG